MSDAVRPPGRREHKHYFESDQWTVVDVEDVDRLFATHTGENEVRIDVDGVNDGSSNVGEPGDRVNLSIWINEGELRDALAGVLEVEDK